MTRPSLLLRRSAIALAAVGLLVGSQAAPAFVPQARAIPVEVVASPVDDIGRILDEILTQLVRAGTVALFNAAQTFLGQLAYDAANYVATGGKGQGPLTQAKSPGDYFAQVGEDALGSAIGSLSDEFFESRLGFDLCSPPNPRNLLNIQISLGGLVPSASGAFSRPRPTCDFQQVVSNYDTFFTTLSSVDLLQNINANFSPNGSELGGSLQIFGRSVGKVGLDVQKAAQDRGEGGAFKGITDVISGNVKTPAALVAASTKEQLVEGPNRDEGARRNAILSSAAEQGPIQLVTYTASMFINTLGSKLMSRIMEKGLIGAFDFSDLDRQTAIASANPNAIPARSRADARRANLSLRDVNLIRQSNVEILSELIACPDVRGTWNCAMDQQLATAISGNACDNGSCTVAKAVETGLMKGDWKMYPDSLIRQNQDPNCYQQAFCSGNLRKLRLMRILPVGFEFAANSETNIDRCASSAGCVTLREVMDGFDTCNDQGERDTENPWCKLIDPNWTLTSFSQQCRLTGFGETLISERFGQRKEECRDIQTCLQRNDKGECVGGYGYCVAEKTVYRFKGDECPEQAASCRVYATRAGSEASFLRNTVDYGSCSSDTVGCLGYATRRSVAVGNAWDAATSSRIYFDATLQTCGANDEGCTKLLAAEVGGSSINLIQNPSFERTTAAPVVLQDWTSVPAGTYAIGSSSVGRVAVDGSLSLELRGVDGYYQSVQTYPGRVLTMSLYSRVKNAGDIPLLNMTATQFDAAGVRIPAAVIDTLFKSPSCLPSSDPGLGTDPAGISTYGTDWIRFECSFLTSNNTASIAVTIYGKNVLVDAADLEDGQLASPFVNGTNNALPVVHMKIAPEELNCTGATGDSPLCAKFASSCRQVDAGCQGYKEASGGPEVPAILSSNDLCPSECVGYAEFRKQSSAFDLVQDPDARFSDPTDDGKAYFIPSTGLRCSQQEVGCELFTNLESAAAGGETATPFSYVRLCEKPDDLAQTYFTWEGSESAGYQLRTWSLVSIAGPATGPKIVARRDVTGAFKDPASCNETLWRTGFDADCRQYYDRDGAVFYAYESQTVISSVDCRTYRIGRRSSLAECSNTGGSFNVTTGECTYKALASASRSCAAPVAGCRAYAGAGAGNVTPLVDENFRGGRGTFSAGAASTESLLVGDQSLRLQSGGGSSLVTSVDFASASTDLFRVSFWAKGSGTGQTMRLQVRDAAVAGSLPADVATAQLSGDWQRFTFGLFNGYTGASTSTLVFTLAGPGSPSAFIDEVRIERVQDMSYVVADSWVTPNSCDRTFSGIPEPQAMLGCRAYTDRFNNTVNAAKFTRLCSAAAIGCRAFVDTRNSDANESQTFVQADAPPVPIRTIAAGTTPLPGDFFPAATTTRAADRMLYLIYDTGKLCQAENDSCRAFGKPVWAMDHGSIESFQTVYYKDDITLYGQGLCRPSEEFCEEYTYNGAKDYFKDPVEKTCEFKDGLRLSAFDFLDSTTGDYSPPEAEFFPEGLYSGWFRTGSNTPCYPDNLQSGNFFGLPKRGDEPYTGWVGKCDAQYGECTEFRDPNDTSDPDHRSGKPYFFIDNSKLDKASCSGNYDQGGGCILLRNTNDPLTHWSTVASDLAYRDNRNRAVQPMDCDENPASPFCAGRCRGKRVTRAGGVSVSEAYVGDLCDTDADCAVPSVPSGCTGRACSTEYVLTCEKPQNDANVIVKVNTDRDCAQWLGCQSAETVFDTATNQYKDVCTNLALCDKVSGEAGDIFCGHYVERDPQTEPVLTEGVYFDADAYASRQTGLGQKDYSGYTIPDSFQVPDTLMTRVGVDGVTVAERQNRFAQDYRLAAVVKIPVNIAPPAVAPYSLFLPAQTGANQAYILDDSDLGRVNPSLRLCQQQGSQIIGYYVKDDKESAISDGKPSFNCYLPVSVRRNSDSYNFQNLVAIFAGASPASDIVLNKAFPEPECRANPEADSPFPARFVTAWDFSTNPPAPTAKISGFQNAKACEFGEDCSCSYKRAEYEIPTLTKFFGTLSSAVPPGICFGGPRNGQSCLPSAILATSGGSSALVDQGLQAANAEQLCGDPNQGGRCIATTKIDLIRGVFGQCLERDTTRILGGDRTAQPCLTWNPNPILFGEKDPYHYQPTSGYLPPQNSGQYYCASPQRAAVTFKMTAADFRRFYQPGDGAVAGQNTRFRGDSFCGRFGPDSGQVDSGRINLQREGRACDPPHTQGEIQGGAGSSKLDNYELQFDQHQSAPYYAGKMSRIDYGPQWLENENRCEGGGGEECDYMSASLVEAHPINNYPSAVQCQLAYNSTGAGAQGNPWPNAVRLVDAGPGYTETFFRINDGQFAGQLGASRPVEFKRALSDNTIGFIRINPAIGSGSGLLGCGYQAPWADNMPSIDYNNADSIRQGESQFRQDLARNYNPYLTRSSEKVLARGPTVTDEAIKMPCLEVDDAPNTGDVGTETDNPYGDAGAGLSDCYFKYWETGLKNTPDKKQFESLFLPGDSIVRNLNDIRKHAFTAASCESGKPYFGVRAMFQTRDNPIDDTSGTEVTAEEVANKGIWRFVGFWVTACAGQAGNDQRYIYMDIDVGAANVCNDLAEVQSKGSRQDAAFTDRVWSQGGFRELNIGTTYGDAASPFSSAINTRPAGKDPLFQTGQELAGFSRLNPPTFLRSGVFTYYKGATNPRDKWAYLSNLFARIYRIYRFQFFPVSRGDLACLEGPFKGTKCTNTVSDPACDINGVCDTSLLTSADASGLSVCNQGPQSGHECTVETECKAPAFPDESGRLIPMLKGCVLIPSGVITRPHWTLVEGTLGQSDARYTGPGGSPSTQTQQQAADAGAFKCSINSARANLDCDVPTGEVPGPDEGNSVECPTALTGTCASGGCAVAGTCNFCRYSNPISDFVEDGTEVYYASAPTTPQKPVGRCEGGVGTPCGFSSADYDAATCAAPDVAIASSLGRCNGGLNHGSLCGGGGSGCAGGSDAFAASCGRVDTGTTFVPVPRCAMSASTTAMALSTNPDTDNNICTHSSGYYPRLDVCPNPSDEYCGLIAYKITETTAAGSINPANSFPLPTDVTLGHYTPTRLGLSVTIAPVASFAYVTYYNPRPPAVAAPDTRACPTPGQCPIASMNTVAFDSQAEGPITAGGGQHKASLRFYAWASHNQMPLRQIMIDWGDGKVQTIEDTKLKNRKPFCGVQKECTNEPGSSSGLTCQTDADCPAGAGRCAPVGTCANRPQVGCSADSDCTVATETGEIKDTCQIRTLFGNSSDACQQDYFDFTHVYTCGANEAALPPCTATLTGAAVPPGKCYYGATYDSFIIGGGFTRPSCTVLSDCEAAYNSFYGYLPGTPLPDPAGSSCGPPVGVPVVTSRCSRDPGRVCTGTAECTFGDTCIENLAPPAGCYDDESTSCRFTPRVMIQDNWGWCTGECRSTNVGGTLADASNSTVRHQYGGCYAGKTFGSPDPNIRFNTKSTEAAPGPSTPDPRNLYVVADSECKPDRDPGSTLRPWIVYPGSLQLRRSNEITE